MSCPASETCVLVECARTLIAYKWDRLLSVCLCVCCFDVWMGVRRAACNCMHLYLSHTHTPVQSFVHSKQSLDSQNSALCTFAIEISRVEFLFLKFVNIDNTAYKIDSFSSICLTRFSSTLCLHWSFVSKFVITLLFIVALVLCNNWNMSSSCPIPVWCRMNNYCLCNWNWRRGECILKFWFRSSCDVDWKMRVFHTWMCHCHLDLN